MTRGMVNAQPNLALNPVTRHDLIKNGLQLNPKKEKKTDLISLALVSPLDTLGQRAVMIALK